MKTEHQWSRRRFIRTAATAAGAAALSPRVAQAQDGWWSGSLEHLIPAANHDRIAIKCSFAEPPGAVPTLEVGNRKVIGQATDSEGRFFAFDVDGLQPDTEYPLRLLDGGGNDLCDSWPLKTFPHPEAKPESVRLLTYTCAGGYPNYGSGTEWFLPLNIRQRLLTRALSFRPQAAIAIGDHIYWDQRTNLEGRGSERGRTTEAFYRRIGWLDRTLPVLGTQNEVSIKAAVGPQISHMYGVLLRSTPSYFVSDDHDYYENDDATQKMVTFPPEKYQLEFARFTRNAYLPEFLPDVGRPGVMSGSGAADRAAGISEAFGTFRYGSLVEALIYDCARFLSLKGDHAGLVPPEVERWLHDRTNNENVSQLLHVPSHPFGWSAGKWREWYPDVADTGTGSGPTVSRFDANATGKRVGLTTEQPKFMWQTGWWNQHQRLLETMSGQQNRPAIVLSGDLHAIGHSTITSSGDMILGKNPIHSVLTGPVGTLRGWPSLARGTPPLTATGLAHEAISPAIEKNGFTMLDITPDDVTVKLFAWKTGEPESAIDTLEPYHTYRIERS